MLEERASTTLTRDITTAPKESVCSVALTPLDLVPVVITMSSRPREGEPDHTSVLNGTYREQPAAVISPSGSSPHCYLSELSIPQRALSRVTPAVVTESSTTE